MLTADRVLWLRRLAVLVTVLTFAIMVMGSWVKATGSGLACPDWPQCYGEWLPPFPSSENQGTYDGEPVTYSQAQVLYEWFHRLLVTILGPFYIAYAIIAWRGTELHPAMRTLPAVGGAVLVLQILLGGVTVLNQNEDWATTLHLATATLFFFIATASLFFAFLRPLAVAAPVSLSPSVPAGRTVYPGEEP
jgi:cytochrome c oxidase assembly protein subunit 15